MKILILTIGFLLYSNLTCATSIAPVSFSRLLNDADAIVEGVYRGNVTRVLPSGEILTEVSIDLKRHAGLNSIDIYNTEGFKVYFPGGIHNNRIVKVNSAPSFKNDEHVILLLEKKSFGYLIQNLSLGKFNYNKKAGEQEYFSSSLFPNHSELGRLTVDRIESLIEKRFSQKFVSTNKQYKPQTNMINSSIASSTVSSREPSSAQEMNNTKISQGSSSVVSVIAIFMALIFCSFYVRRKKRSK